MFNETATKIATAQNETFLSVVRTLDKACKQWWLLRNKNYDQDITMILVEGNESRPATYYTYASNAYILGLAAGIDNPLINLTEYQIPQETATDEPKSFLIARVLASDIDALEAELSQLCVILRTCDCN